MNKNKTKIWNKHEKYLTWSTKANQAPLWSCKHKILKTQTKCKLCVHAQEKKPHALANFKLKKSHDINPTLHPKKCHWKLQIFAMFLMNKVKHNKYKAQTSPKVP